MSHTDRQSESSTPSTSPLKPGHFGTSILDSAKAGGVVKNEDLALADIRAAWDAYRNGVDLPLSEAWMFAAGFLAAQAKRPASDARESTERIALLSSLLARGHAKTLRNLYCDGAPVGRMLLNALAEEVPVVPDSPAPVLDDATAVELARYRWVRQPSNLNCMMFEFKGNTPAQADAYIDKQIKALATKAKSSGER